MQDKINKQETLEEAAVNCWAEGAWDNRDDFTDGFIEGAKWQQEQDKNKFSEEEVLEILDKRLLSVALVPNRKSTEHWFRQYTKKEFKKK
jgi:hypothetical protein